jgi:hypothetical protein
VKRSFVADASVAIAWVHPAQATAETDAMLDRLAAGDSLVVPALLKSRNPTQKKAARVRSHPPRLNRSSTVPADEWRSQTTSSSAKRGTHPGRGGPVFP